MDNTKANERLYLIDCSAPFFYPVVDGTRQNWSKSPLEKLTHHGTLNKKYHHDILRQIRKYCKTVKSIGYTAVTLDDLAHITMFDFYPYHLCRTIRSYQELLLDVVDSITSIGLEVYITTDIIFWNEYIEKSVGQSDKKQCLLFIEALERLFDLFTKVSGVVLRIGESDGVDVDSLFKSRMVIKKAAQCNRWLQEMLPVFEERHKRLIFRTWGLGAFPIGDLIWHAKTEERAFRGIQSSHFIISRKYGPADFFRYLLLSERIRHSQHKQIVEFQARREYEGFGVFPSYVGYLYETFRDELQDVSTLCGVSVWAQTGGWSHFDQLTFLKSSSLWNEMNVSAVIRLFRFGESAEHILKSEIEKRFESTQLSAVETYVHLCEELIESLWYYKPYAQNERWFRRLRFPPLLWIFWDTILVNRAIRKLFRHMTPDKEKQKLEDKLQKKIIKELMTVGEEAGIESEELLLTVETFKLVYGVRKFYLSGAGKKAKRRLQARVKGYQKKCPHGFKVEVDLAPFRLRWITSDFLFALLLREHAHYRLLDRFILVPVTGWIFPLFKKWQQKKFPAIAEKQAVGIELFFR